MRTLLSSPCQLRLGVVLRHYSLSSYIEVNEHRVEDLVMLSTKDLKYQMIRMLLMDSECS